jgi:hypothetical protein
MVGERRAFFDSLEMKPRPHCALGKGGYAWLGCSEKKSQLRKQYYYLIAKYDV